MSFRPFPILLMALITAMPAHGAEIAAAYHASWAALPAADIELQLDDDGAAYRDQIHIATKGMPRWFTHFAGKAVSEGKLANAGPAPSRYDALYSLRKRTDSHISMRMVPRDGAVITERGPEDTSRKAPLDEQYRRDVIDPLTAITVLRHGLSTQPRQPGIDYRMPIYDGARRFDVMWHILPKDEPGETFLRLELWLHPIAGFKGEFERRRRPRRCTPQSRAEADRRRPAAADLSARLGRLDAAGGEFRPSLPDGR